MKLFNFRLLVFFCFLTVVQFTANAQEYKAGELLIQLKKNASIEDLTAVASLRSNKLPALQLKKTISKDFGIYLLAFDQQRSTQAVLSKLRKHPAIENAQVNARATLRETTPNDPLYDQQWHLEKIDAPEAWDITTGGLTANGDTIVIAVIDTGCDVGHSDINGNLWFNKGEIPNDGLDNDNNGFIDDYNGWNVRKQSDEQPDGGHGCGVSGIIGAVGDNSIGTSGINWNVKIMQISQAEYTDEIVEAYVYAFKMRKLYNESNGAKGAFVVVTNYSAGINDAFCDQYPIWGSMYDSLGCVGILNIAATTNRNINIDETGDMPTTCPSDFLIGTTSTGRRDDKATGAGFGIQNIDLGAPGVSIFSTQSMSRFGEIGTGTSFATPMVAGTVALLYSIPSQELADLSISNPKQAASFMRDAILEGVDLSVNLTDKVATGGRLNIFNSILELQNKFGGKVGALGICEIRPSLATRGDRVEVIYQKPDLEAYDVKVYDATGKFMIEGTIEAGLTTKSFFIDNLEFWPAGVYFVTIQNNRNIVSGKFVIY